MTKQQSKLSTGVLTQKNIDDFLKVRDKEYKCPLFLILSKEEDEIIGDYFRKAGVNVIVKGEYVSADIFIKNGKLLYDKTN